jgi:hypothetical protein
LRLCDPQLKQGDHRAPAGAGGVQPPQGLQEGQILPQLAGLQAPTGGQLAEGNGEHRATCGAQLQVAVELGDAEGTGGSRAAQIMGCGMGLQGIVGVGEGLAMHCKKLQSHGIGADETGYPERSEVLLEGWL